MREDESGHDNQPITADDIDFSQFDTSHELMVRLKDLRDDLDQAERNLDETTSEKKRAKFENQVIKYQGRIQTHLERMHKFVEEEKAKKTKPEPESKPEPIPEPKQKKTQPSSPDSTISNPENTKIDTSRIPKEAYDDALKTVQAAGKASANLLSKDLKINREKAKQLLAKLEEEGVIGPANGNRAREVLQTSKEIKPADLDKLNTAQKVDHSFVLREKDPDSLSEKEKEVLFSGRLENARKYLIAKTEKAIIAKEQNGGSRKDTSHLVKTLGELGQLL